jgi:CRP/FNR family transcriptional regulator, dissimilatory nitrate respiration regulator
MKTAIIEKLQSATFFNGLNETQLEKICNKSKIVSFNKDEIIFCQGNEAKAFFLIVQGWVTIIKENQNAEQSVLHVFKDGDSFAEPAALVIGCYPASAYAASSCDLLEIKASSLKSMIKEDPDIALRMIARLSIQLNTLVNEFEQYKTMGVPRRLAMFLLELWEQNPDKNCVDLPFNKTVLAAHLGIQPGTLSRAFNQLAQYGVKSDRSSHILLDDIECLKKYVNNST